MVLEKIKSILPNEKIKIIWDGISYHRAKSVYSKANSLGMKIIQLPAYSPDFMPVEDLWQWLRSEVTKNYCHSSAKDLLARVSKFVETINKSPAEIADRLWRTTNLIDEEKKLRISSGKAGPLTPGQGDNHLFSLTQPQKNTLKTPLRTTFSSQIDAPTPST